MIRKHIIHLMEKIGFLHYNFGDLIEVLLIIYLNHLNKSPIENRNIRIDYISVDYVDNSNKILGLFNNYEIAEEDCN